MDVCSPRSGDEFELFFSLFNTLTKNKAKNNAGYGIQEIGGCGNVFAKNKCKGNALGDSTNSPAVRACMCVRNLMAAWWCCDNHFGSATD